MPHLSMYFSGTPVKWYHQPTDLVNLFEIFIGTSFLDLVVSTSFLNLPNISANHSQTAKRQS